MDFMEFHGIHGFHGIPWNPWISLEFHGIHGFPWIPWKSMKSMEFHEIHGNPHSRASHSRASHSTGVTHALIALGFSSMGPGRDPHGTRRHPPQVRVAFSSAVPPCMGGGPAEALADWTPQAVFGADGLSRYTTLVPKPVRDLVGG